MPLPLGEVPCGILCALRGTGAVAEHPRLAPALCRGAVSLAALRGAGGTAPPWGRGAGPQQGVPCPVSVPAQGYPCRPEGEPAAALLSRPVPSPPRALAACAGLRRSPSAEGSWLVAIWCPWVSETTWNPLKLLWRLCEVRGVTRVSTPRSPGHPARFWALARREGGDPRPPQGRKGRVSGPCGGPGATRSAVAERRAEVLRAPTGCGCPSCPPSRLSGRAGESRAARWRLGGFCWCLLSRERPDRLPGVRKGIVLHLPA